MTAWNPYYRKLYQAHFGEMDREPPFAAHGLNRTGFAGGSNTQGWSIMMLRRSYRIAGWMEVE